MGVVWTYIVLLLGVVIWTVLMPIGKKVSDRTMRAITVFGGAFLLGVCFLELLPEVSEFHCPQGALLPYMAVLAGFLVQQVLDGLSAHAEHGHTEEGFTIGGLMLGLCLHAFLEGMPLVWDNHINQGLLWGIVVHNVPVALLLTGMMAARGYGFWRVLGLLTLFGIMSPLGSLCSQFLLQPDATWQGMITGIVVGVLLHVSSSILFDHKRNHFSWANIALTIVAFAAAALITH